MSTVLTVNTLHKIVQSTAALDEIILRTSGFKISGNSPQTLAAGLHVIADSPELSSVFAHAFLELVAAVHDLGESPASVGVSRSR